MDQFDMPKGWEEISLETYCELLDIEFNQSLTKYEKDLEKLCLVTDSDHWEDEDFTEIYSALRLIPWLNFKPTGKPLEPLKDFWSVKPFSKYTLAEWIDLDKFISTYDLPSLAALMYRKTDIDQWGNIIFEPYIFSTKQRGQEFNKFSITSIIGSIEEVTLYRKKVLNNFSSIFTSAVEEDFVETEEDKKYLSPGEIEEQKRFVELENKMKKYSWETLLDNASNGDWSKIESILDMPATVVFNMMTMNSLRSKSELLQN